MLTRLLALVFAAVFALHAQQPAKTPRRATPASAVARQRTAAQTKADSAPAFPLSAIHVEGNQLYSPQQLIQASGLRPGQLVSKAEFDAARDRLLATGVFESVAYRFGPNPAGSGYEVTFEVQELKQRYPFRLEGLHIDRQALDQYLAGKDVFFSSLLPGTQVVLDRYAQWIAEFLAGQSRGSEERIIGRVNANPKGELEIIFRPERLPSVAEVDFRGNKVVDSETLRRAVAGAAIGALYTEERFQQILDTSIRPLYESRGRVRVRFPRLHTTPAGNATGLKVVVEVDEGDVYRLGKVTSNGTELDPNAMKAARFRPGEEVNLTEVAAGVDELVRGLKRRGYLRARGGFVTKINDSDKTVDVEIRLEPGEQFRFGKLRVQGLDIHGEAYIRKLWGLKPFQTMNAEYPQYFLDRVREDGIFENLGKTSYALTFDEDNQIVDVTLQFSSDGKPLPRIGPGADDKRHRRPY